MTELAALGLSADSSGVVKATGDLDKLSGAAGRAEMAAEELAIGAKKADVALRVVGDDARATTGSLDRMSLSARGTAAGSLTRLTAAARPVSMQLSQVAQQTMATGNAVQALAIQLPDIGLAFGTIGTVVGVLAGIGLPILISALGGSNEKAEALDKTIDNLAGSVGSLRSALDDANQSWSDLSYQFGENTAKARELFALIVEMRTFEAEQSLAASSAAITESLGGLVEYYQKYQDISLSIYDNEDRRRVQAGQLRDLISDMKDEYGLTLIQARDVTSALDDMANASGPAQMADAARELYESIMDAKRAGADIPPEMIDVARETLNAAQQALYLDGHLGDAKESASGLAGVDMASNISSAAYQAAILAGNFQAAVTAASQLGGYAPDLNRFSSPSPFMFPTDNAPTDSPRPNAAPNGIGGVDWGLPPSTGRGGGGGGGNDRQSALDSLISDLSSQREVLTAWYDEKMTLIQSYTDLELESLGGKNEAIERLEAEHRQRLWDINQSARQMEIDAQRGMYGELSGLLGMFATESRAAAIVQIGINTALRLAEAAQNTAAASIRAIAELGPIAGPPAAAKIAAYGKVQMGLIAAAGVAQGLGSGRGGSGSGGGAGSSGANSAQTSTPEAPLRVSAQAFDPNGLYTGEAIQKVFDAVQKEAGNRGIIWVPQ